MSFNIRYDNPNDGENNWSKRRENVTRLILQQYPDIVGLQETLKNQIIDLMSHLQEYNWFGVGREDGKEKGELVPIFYKKNRLRVIEKSTFWLSKTPLEPGGYSWDAKYGRIVTWGRFFDKKNKKNFFLFNTHFDKDGKTSRIKNAKILVTKIKEIANNNAVIVTGDFNCIKSSEPYQILTRTNYSRKIKLKLKDSEAISHKQFGPKGTITNFKTIQLPERKIDHIFVNGYVYSLSHSIVSKKWNGKFPSDHLPVVIDILL